MIVYILLDHNIHQSYKSLFTLHRLWLHRVGSFDRGSLVYTEITTDIVHEHIDGGIEMSITTVWITH